MISRFGSTRITLEDWLDGVLGIEIADTQGRKLNLLGGIVLQVYIEPDMTEIASFDAPPVVTVEADGLIIIRRNAMGLGRGVFDFVLRDTVEQRVLAHGILPPTREA